MKPGGRDGGRRVSSLRTPRYEDAVSIENGRRVLGAVARLDGESNFAMIEAESGVRGSVLYYHLNRLSQLDVIENMGSGHYRLRFKSPFCFIMGTRGVPSAYFGLLGTMEGRKKPETEVALALLKREPDGIEPKRVRVVTSAKAQSEWEELKLPYDWLTLYEDDITDMEKVREKARPELELLIKDHSVVLDCTSSTKPATLAFYQLAQQYSLPLVYVYERGPTLKWLASRKSLAERFGM